MSRLLQFWIARPLACGALVAALGVGLRAQAAPAAAGTPDPMSGWRISGAVAQGMDSNILSALSHPEADSTTQMQLGLSRTWSGRGWSFQADYDPAAVSYVRHAKLDFVSHAYHQMWNYALGPHTRITWGTDAQRYPTRGGVPTGGLAPLSATAGASQAMALQAVLTGANSNLELNHQYSRRSSWSVGVAGGLQDYSRDNSLAAAGAPGASANAVFGHSSTLSAHLGWSHQVGASTSVQVGATQTEMQFSNLNQRVRYDSLQVSLQQGIGSALSLQVGAGPAWSRTRSGAGAATFSLPGTSYAANASLMAQWGHNQYGLSWQHSDQLGLTAGGLTTDMLALQVGLRLTQNWSGNLNVGQSRGTTTTAAPGGAAQDSAFASTQMFYHMTLQWSLQASATYFTQAVPTGLGTSQPFRHLQASIGLSYVLGGAQ
ncbi:MAG TPA: hypothetical protein VNF74_11740 [Terriglobales bacterium]|nr:hypothetical protein [Terriglobales bacterium]